MRRTARWFVVVLGWATVAPLAAVALARVVAWDSRSVLVGLNAITPVLYVPAWPVAILAGVLRSWVLFAVAVFVVLGHVAFVLPELVASEPVPVVARAAPKLRLFAGNVYEANPDVAAYAGEIRRARPDLVVLAEATPAVLARLDATGVLAELPHRITVNRRDPAAAAVLSRWPLTDDDVVFVQDRPVLIRTTVAFPEGSFRLFAVHVVAPFAQQRKEWIEGLDAVHAAVVAERAPVLLAGDFNATWGHRAFRRLLDEGVTDAAAARRHPFQMTWPANRRILPPLARIDHVMTTEGLIVVGIRRGAARGSDHRPLIAEVAMVPRAG